MAAARELESFSKSVREQQGLLRTPPPSYDAKVTADVPAIVLAELTTTKTEVVKTTTQTTHFFIPVCETSATQFPSFSDDTSTAFVIEKRATRGPLVVDKELPPTPVEDSDSSSPDLVSDEGTGAQNEPSIRPQPPGISDHPLPFLRRPSTWNERSPSASALARASLGIGLPHVMPRASAPASRSTSEVNTVPFGQEQDVSITVPFKISAVRKTKSFRFLRDSAHKPDQVPTLTSERPRGISCSDARTSSKIKDGGEGQGSGSRFRSLSRRASFFTKKKAAPEATSANGPPPKRDRAPSLPLIPSFTPLDKSLHISSPSTSVDRLGRHDHPPPPPPPKDRDAISAFPKPTNKRVHAVTMGSIGRMRSRSLHSPPERSPSRIRPSATVALFSESNTGRQRRESNPPLLQRLSLNLFASPTPSTPSMLSPTSTPLSEMAPSLQKPPQKAPAEGESPHEYVRRISATFSKADVAGILASSGDSFYTEALRLYIKTFNFSRDPLDVAMRKLLMDLGLPRETQQIDRVIQAFAGQYSQCNPDLFSAEDHPYILAFSLMMLHTDAFNKSNKRKMTKADYVKNTRLPGVFPETLDCFYDNIVFAPFIFIEGPAKAIGQVATGIGTPPTRTLTSNTFFLGKGNKNDPYQLITHNLLEHLRLHVEEVLPLESPFTYVGTEGSWDDDRLRSSFDGTKTIEIGPTESNRTSTPFLNRSDVDISSTPSLPQDLVPIEVWTLTLAKCGTLSRKDDCLEGGKRSNNRKWRNWGVILTRSQLLFFRDPMCAHNVLAQMDASKRQARPLPASLLTPDEVCSLAGSIAVYDRSYTKYSNVLRVVGVDGRQFLLQASDEQALNEWISCINYASALRTAGIPVPGLGVLKDDVEFLGIASSDSTLADSQNSPKSISKNASRDGVSQTMESQMLIRKSHDSSMTSTVDEQLESRTTRESLGVGPILSTHILANNALPGPELMPSKESLPKSEPPSESATVATSRSSPHISAHFQLRPRRHILRQKILDLEAKIGVAQTQLDTDMRFVRNIAILTPFRQSTRDRLRKALQEVAKRIAQTRLELTRLTCYRDVLSDYLSTYHGHRPSTAPNNFINSSRSLIPPRMTLSLHEGDPALRPKPLEIDTLPEPPALVPQPLDIPQPSSTVSDAFYTALDYGSDWPTPSSDTELSSFLGDPRRGFDSPATRSSAGSSFLSDHPAVPERGTPFPSEGRTQGHDSSVREVREATDEHTEEWSESQCAQHVSIVRMPSELRLPTFLRRYQSKPTRTDVK